MNTLLKGLKAGEEKICVVGLGYVGLPLAVSLVDGFWLAQNFLNN
jgi:UDP-N-acetyl-D-mannosaminuronate dehydrogenase